MLEAAIIRLSDESRYLRFGTPKPRVSERELYRACDVGHSAVRANVLAANLRSIAMLRRAGFKGCAGTVPYANTNSACAGDTAVVTGSSRPSGSPTATRSGVLSLRARSGYGGARHA